MQDLKHALRLFAKSPAITAITVAVLALGIGANTAVFSIVYGTLLRPPPYQDPGRLVTILDTSPREKELAKVFASYSDLEEYSRHSHTLQSVAAATWAGRPAAVLSGRGPAKAYLTIPVTAGFFQTLGVAAQRGRTFTSSDLRGGCEVVLSDKFWRDHLSAEPRILGDSLTLDQQACAVVGIMPPGFAAYPPETQIWTLLLPNDPRLRNYFPVFIIGRLKPGASFAQVRSELANLHRSLHARDPNGEREWTPLVTGIQEQFTWLAGRNLPQTLAILFASVILVLSIACMNVANLLLAQSLGRTREFATRMALGSSQARLLRQLLIESALLSGAGALLGLVVAFAAIRYFLHVQPIELPAGSTVSINLPALLFAVAVSVVTALIFAIVPCWAISRGDVNAGLRSTRAGATPSRQYLARMLVGAEMALSVILLAGAGLFMRSVLGFESAPLGFASGNIFASEGSLPPGRYQSTEKRGAFYESLQRALDSVPGITSAAIASTLPPYGLGLGTVEIEGKPVRQSEQLHDVGNAEVSSAYFRLFEIPLRRGHLFNRLDQPNSQRVAIVNEEFQHEYFLRENPIGHRIRIGDEHDWVTVIGVVGNEKRPTVYEEMKWVTQPIVYRPVSQQPPEGFAIALRTAAPPGAIGRALEKAAQAIDDQATLTDLEPMRLRLEFALKYPRFRAALLTAFSLLAIVLAAVGLYGVLAQFVTQRTAEIGVRMAVGAQGPDIVSLIAWKGGVPAFAGFVTGLTISILLTRYVASLLYGITATDPATFGVVAAVMIAATALAMILPARRASRIDPITALRTE